MIPCVSLTISVSGSASLPQGVLEGGHRRIYSLMFRGGTAQYQLHCTPAAFEAPL